MSKPRAFTLIEVIVGVSILGIGIALGMGLFAAGLNNASTSNDYASAVLIAQDLMVQRLSAAKLAPGSEEGDEGAYHWTVDVERYQKDETQPLEETGPLALFQIIVKVAWQGRLGKKTYDLAALRTIAGTSWSTTTPAGGTGGTGGIGGIGGGYRRPRPTPFPTGRPRPPEGTPGPFPPGPPPRMR